MSVQIFFNFHLTSYKEHLLKTLLFRINHVLLIGYENNYYFSKLGFSFIHFGLSARHSSKLVPSDSAARRARANF